MQNIPSHADDIRHMFRATASRDETRECKISKDNEIIVTLPTCYKVECKDGFKNVETLSIGDQVKLHHDKEDVWLSVVDVDRRASSSGCSYSIQFVV